jgi:peptidoglycan hydrolase CwlO-like protein
MTAAILMLSVTLANCSQTLVPKSIIDIDSFIQSAAAQPGEVCDECKDKAEDYAKKFDELKKHMKDLEKINKQVRKLQKEVDKTIKK